MLGKTEGRRRRQCQKMRCNKHKFGQTLGGGEIQGHLACCSPWGHKELHTTGQLNNNTGMCQIELEQKRMSLKGDRGLFVFFFFFPVRFGSHFHDWFLHNKLGSNSVDILLRTFCLSRIWVYTNQDSYMEHLFIHSLIYLSINLLTIWLAQSERILWNWIHGRHWMRH